MDTTSIANSGLMWAVAGIILVAVIIQTIMFMRRGWVEAKDRGVPGETIKRVVRASAIFSIAPTLAIPVVMYALVPILGIPMPWLRVSVIGNAAFETVAATLGVTALGESFAPGLTPQAWAAAMWVMTVGCTSAAVITVLILRPICTVVNNVSSHSMILINLLGLFCIAGVVSAICIQFCTTTAPVMIISASAFAVSFGLACLVKKKPQLKKVNDYNLCIGMLTGLAVAAFVA